MNVTDAIQKRSSTRGYKAQALTEEQLNRILQAGLQSPTAINRQEVHFTALEGGHPLIKEIEEEKNRLRGLKSAEHNFCYEAPTVILLSGEKGNKWSPVDAGIAVQSMALVAEDLGLGSLIIGCIYDALRGERRDYFEKALKFPPNHEFEIALALGHKAVEKLPHVYDALTHVTHL